MNRIDFIFNDILQDYGKIFKLKIDKYEHDRHCCCICEYNEIYISLSFIDKLDDDRLFSFLHEIGHLITKEETSKEFCIEVPVENEVFFFNPDAEFDATTWAIKAAKKYGVIINEDNKRGWERYIDDVCNMTNRINNFVFEWD